MAGPADNRTLGELMSELSRETGTLVRKELELATIELTSRLREAGTQIAVTSAGGALMYAGLLVLLAAFVAGLVQMGLQPWLAAFIVAAATMSLGYVLMNRGLARLRRIPLAPRQTIETLKESARWTTGQSA